ncbi:hypothetical protein ACFW6N_35960 [Streptomyces cyaneofuscatus]|uniref:hypothetical protein n=1 Tax=Streptomyces cyaneofuscatus TaxID=66883 RepID=UPI0036833570
MSRKAFGSSRTVCEGMSLVLSGTQGAEPHPYPIEGSSMSLPVSLLLVLVVALALVEPARLRGRPAEAG